MKTNIRELVKELLEDKSLIVNYNELQNGGFDLSVRIDEEKLNTSEEIDKILSEPEELTCPKCGSKNIQSMYGTIKLDGLGKVDGSGHLIHYICNNCLKEFEVGHDK